MEDKTEELFHTLFNKINNICVAAATNKKLLQEENRANLSEEESEERFTSIMQVFKRIEDSALLLDENLKVLYQAYKADKNLHK